MLMNFERHVHLDSPSAQLNDSLLSFSKSLYLREKRAVDLHYCFLLALGGIAMDGDQFSLTIFLGPLFIQLSSQGGH